VFPSGEPSDTGLIAPSLPVNSHFAASISRNAEISDEDTSKAVENVKREVKEVSEKLEDSSDAPIDDAPINEKQ